MERGRGLVILGLGLLVCGVVAVLFVGSPGSRDAGDDGETSNMHPDGGALQGRAPAKGTLEKDPVADVEPAFMVVGGIEPRRDDHVIRVLGPKDRPISRARFIVYDLDRDVVIHEPYIEDGNAWIPRERIPRRARVTVRLPMWARGQGLLDVEIEDVNLLELAEIRLVEGRLLVGVVRDADGLEEQDISIRIAPERMADGRRDGFGLRTKTDRDGRYRIFAPPRARVELIATSNRIDRPVLSKTIEPGSAAPDFVLPREVGLVITLEDARGDGIEGLSLSFSLPYGRDGQVHRQEERTRGSEGRVYFDALPPDGLADIVVKTPTVAHPYLPVRREGVRVDQGELRITLQRGADITGRVMQSDGQVVTSGTVTAAPLGGQVDASMTRQVADDGTFTLAGLRPGAYRVSASAGSGSSLAGAEPIEVTAPARGVELTMLDTYAVHGSFEPGSATGLKAYLFTGATPIVRSLGPSGFTMRGLPEPGGLLFIGSPGDPRYAFRRFDTDGELGHLEIRRGQCITGRVEGLTRSQKPAPAGGVIITMAQAIVEIECGEISYEIRDVGFDGSFRTFGLPLGSHPCYVTLWDAKKERLIESKRVLSSGHVTLRYR